MCIETNNIDISDYVITQHEFGFPSWILLNVIDFHRRISQFAQLEGAFTWPKWRSSQAVVTIDFLT